ncbi:hypothetical protein BBJ28_00009623, partial [Nothophytophthora sp. Chile5]
MSNPKAALGAARFLRAAIRYHRFSHTRIHHHSSFGFSFPQRKKRSQVARTRAHFMPLSSTSPPRRSSASRAERLPLLAGAPPPQVFAHPVECASLTSRLLLQWVAPALALANRPRRLVTGVSVELRGLQQSDVWELPPRARAEPGANALQRAWIASGSLLLAFARAHGLKFVALGGLHAAAQLCELLGPYVLFRAVMLLQSDSDSATEAAADAEIGRQLLFWLGVLLTTRLLRALLATFVRAELQTATLRLAAALQSLVFQKALRLPDVSSREADALYAADVDQLLHGAACLHELWVTPLLLALVLTLIAHFVGAAACGSCAVAAFCTLVLAHVLAHMQFRALTRLQRTREDRQHAIRDMVRAMPAVKLHAWEPAARARVNATRGRELAALWRFQALGAVEIALGFAAPALIATAALAVGYRSPTLPLTPAAAFATLALVRLMQTPLRTLPEALVGVQRAHRALRNLSRFMDQDELDPYAVARRDSLGLVAKYDPQDVVVAVEDATLAWATTGPLVFQHLDLTVGAGELLVVHGRPASGKSSFLAALLGEMQARDGSDGGNGSGRVYVGGSVAYCTQQPWLQQTLSVRDNVLFGQPYDRRKYQRVLDACALVNSLTRLPAGDRTLVQDWAPTTGQQALVSLARACYSDADVYLLDEPLAHCRPTVARAVFTRCLLSLLRNKTRVLVTRRAEFVGSEFVDDAIRFEDGGRLVHSRDVVEVKEQNEQTQDEEESGEEDELAVNTSNRSPGSSPGAGAAVVSQPPHRPKEERVSVELLAMENAMNMTWNSLTERPLREFLSCETASDAQWGEDEGLRDSVRAYVRAVGGVRVAVVISFLLFFWQAFQLLSELWVAFWTRPGAPGAQSSSLAADQLIYSALTLSAGLLVLAYALGIAVTAVEGARRVFLSLAAALLNAPLVFFDIFGAGSGKPRAKKLTLGRRRELERVFTGEELSDLDARLPLAGGAALALAASTMTALLTAVVVTRYYALLLAPVLYLYARAARSYLRPARDLRHLERTARQAARLHSAEVLAGARVVRAFGLAHVHRVLGHQFWLLDITARDAHLAVHADQWLALRVQLYGAMIVGIVAASSLVALRHTLSAGLLALALYEALVVDSGALESLVRVWAWLIPVLPTAVRTQAAVSGTEVVTTNHAYATAMARRASAPLTPVQADAKPSLSWPAKGDLRFDGVSLRDPAAASDETDDVYQGADGGAPPLALRGVSFRLQAGEKVAVVESSTTALVSSVGRALVRVHELAAGRIVVDGVDVATLGLRTLRSRVACVSAIAPSTALYDGTVRTQLDPIG